MMRPPRCINCRAPITDPYDDGRECPDCAAPDWWTEDDWHAAYAHELDGRDGS